VQALTTPVERFDGLPGWPWPPLRARVLMNTTFGSGAVIARAALESWARSG
jgi:hypothetical protein